MHKTLRNLTIFILISFTLLTLIAAVATANNSDCGNKGCHANIVENYNTSNQTSHTYCVDCHNETLTIPHTETPVSEPNTCKSCHQNKVNNFTNSKHGYMKCSSCHDVHGNSTKYKSLKKNLTVPLIDISYKDSDFELCYMCHNQTALLLVPNPDQRMIDYKNWFGIPYYTGSWTTDFREMVGAWWDNDNNSEGFQSNLHYDHIARFRGSGSKQWDSNGDGIYEYDSCVTCHDPHGTTNPRFTVLDLNFTWDITNGNNVGGNISGFNGTYCNNCHFYGGNYSRINLTSASIIDSNLTLGGPNCIGCHGLNALYERINESAVAIGIHINITGDPNPSNPNSRCWKCHTSDGNAPPEGKHPDRALNPYTCENCHGSTPPASVAPPHIYEHASYGADIATNATCVNCHNNSLVYYGTIPNATITDLYNVAHYGKHPNQGANQVNTTDCNYCHNQSNADIRLKWGNAFQVNSTNMFGATTSSDCYPCHVDDGKIPSNFHIETLNAGGGTDCVTCHDLGKNVPRVDVSAMNNTTYSIHKGLNKDVVTNLTNDSKRCWACHGTGEEPTKHLSDLTKVKYCEDCHNNTNSATNFSAPQVAEHFINGSDIKVLKAKQCPFCHNKTQMKLPYTEPDTKWSNFSLVSHYGKKRTDMNNGTQTDCAYCHTNGGKEFNDTFVKSSNTYITHNGTKQCYECHSSGRFHNESIRGGGNPNCISCHDVGSTGAEHLVNATSIASGVHANVNNNTANSSDIPAENKKCWGCHTSNGTQPLKMGDRYGNPWQCQDCHMWNGTRNASSWETQNPGSPVPPAIYEHAPNGTDIVTNISVEGFNRSVASCLQCHNNSIGNTSGTQGGNLSANVSHYATTDFLMAPYKNSTDCNYCHNQSNSEIRIAWGNAPQNSVTGMNYENYECWECHEDNMQMPLNFHNETLNKGSDCRGCHFNYSRMNSLNKPEKYVNGTMFNTSVHGNKSAIDCRDCHTKGHPPPESNLKWCEDCHSVQKRHNITSTPQNNLVNGTSVLKIIDCTTCHDANAYNNAKNTFNKTSGKDCRWCHSFPDKTYN